MFKLPDEKRHYFKEPFGELFPDITGIIPRLSGKTIYSVGDIVTHNLQKKGASPSVAIVDGHTMRSPCKKILSTIGKVVRVKNSAGTISDELIATINDAVTHPPMTIYVNGEEDLAVIPLVIAAPMGSMVLYGQPHKGVVVKEVDIKAKEQALELLSHFIHTD